MRYWWVNHKQTFRHEFGGNYIWSPKTKRGGAFNRFYETMREVAPGDVVFSYAGGVIQAFGVAQTHCYTSPRPNEFGHIGEAWDELGWRVDVNLTASHQQCGRLSIWTCLRPFCHNAIHR